MSSKLLLVMMSIMIVMVRGDVKMYLTPGGGGGIWNGVCISSSCTIAAPCSLPLSGSLTLSGDDDCEITLVAYDPLPPVSLIAGSVTKRINVTTDDLDGLVYNPGPALTFSFSGSETTLRFKQYRGQHNQTMSLSVKHVWFEEAEISDSDFSGSGLFAPTATLFTLNTPLSTFNLVKCSLDVWNFAQAFLFVAAGNPKATFDDFEMSSHYPLGAYTVSVLYATGSLQSITMTNFKTSGLTPFAGAAQNAFFENGLAIDIGRSYQSGAGFPMSQFTLRNFNFTMAEAGVAGYMLENVKNVLIENVTSPSFFTSGAFASLKLVEYMVMKDCDINGWVLVDSTEVTSGEVEIFVNQSRISMAHSFAGTPLIVLAPALSTLATRLVLEEAQLEITWAGYELSFQNHIIIPHEVTFNRLSLRSGLVTGKFTAPKLEVINEIRGGSFAGDTPAVEFDTSLTVHATQFRNIVPTLRDDELFYFPEDRFGVGMQAFPPFAVSKIWISWNLTAPAVFSTHPVGFGLTGITLFSTLPGDDRYNISGQYYASDPTRSYMTFGPIACPLPCANSLATFRSDSGTLQSLCSASDRCFSEMLEAEIVNDVSWDFGPLSILPNGSVSFLGNSSEFGNHYTLGENAISKFEGDASFGRNLEASQNTSLTVKGNTAIQSNVIAPVNGSLAFYGDFGCQDLEIGPGSAFIAGSQATSLGELDLESHVASAKRAKRATPSQFTVAGSLTFNSVTASISSPSGSIQRDFILNGNTDLTVDGQAHFVIRGNLQFSSNTKISVQPNLSGTSASTKRTKRDASTPYFETSGVAYVAGSVQVNLTNEDIQTINGTSGKIVLVKGSTISGNIELLVESDTDGCASLTGVGEPQVEDSSGSELLVVFLTTNIDGCNSSPSEGPMTPTEIEAAKKAKRTWPIILGSVLGGVALITLIAIVLVITVPSIKAYVVPYSA
jgi:hypothetical protein